MIIEEKADLFINQINSEVNIIPSLEQQQRSSANIGSTFESILDINSFSNNSNVFKIDNINNGQLKFETNQLKYFIYLIYILY
jgi:hypothetical protein